MQLEKSTGILLWHAGRPLNLYLWAINALHEAIVNIWARLKSQHSLWRERVLCKSRPFQWGSNNSKLLNDALDMFHLGSPKPHPLTIFRSQSWSLLPKRSISCSFCFEQTKISQYQWKENVWLKFVRRNPPKMCWNLRCPAFCLIWRFPWVNFLQILRGHSPTQKWVLSPAQKRISQWSIPQIWSSHNFESESCSRSEPFLSSSSSSSPSCFKGRWTLCFRGQWTGGVEEPLTSALGTFKETILELLHRMHLPPISHQPSLALRYTFPSSSEHIAVRGSR